MNITYRILNDIFKLFFFIVNGNWAEWENWSPCSLSCGGGQRLRFRFCTIHLNLNAMGPQNRANLVTQIRVMVRQQLYSIFRYVLK